MSLWHLEKLKKRMQYIVEISICWPWQDCLIAGRHQRYIILYSEINFVYYSALVYLVLHNLYLTYDCLLLVGRELFEKGHFCRASVCDCYNLQGSANEGDELFSYTIITVDAAPSLKWLHNRMPVSPTIICLWVFQFIVC